MKSADSHHQHAWLKAISRASDGSLGGTMQMELRSWPEWEEAVAAINSFNALAGDRVLTFSVKPPAKKYQPEQDPPGQDRLF